MWFRNNMKLNWQFLKRYKRVELLVARYYKLFRILCVPFSCKIIRFSLIKLLGLVRAPYFIYLSVADLCNILSRTYNFFIRDVQSLCYKCWENTTIGMIPCHTEMRTRCPEIHNSLLRYETLPSNQWQINTS